MAALLADISAFQATLVTVLLTMVVLNLVEATLFIRKKYKTRKIIVQLNAIIDRKKQGR